MAATQIGTTLILSGQRSIPNYIVVSDGVGDSNVVSEEIETADGAFSTNVCYRNEAIIKLTLISKSGATPTTEFPKGAMCTITGLTTYIVDDCNIDRSKGPERTTVTLRKIL